MSEIDADEAEIARIISQLPEFSWLTTADFNKIHHEIQKKISQVLKEYYLENTQGKKPTWTVKFTSAGITPEDGKTMIACARRLGIEIS